MHAVLCVVSDEFRVLCVCVAFAVRVCCVLFVVCVLCMLCLYVLWVV